MSTAAGTQKVVIVNGSPQILELLENVLEAGRYDIVFVESSEHAYSQIKRVQPNLVILCVQIDAMDTFQVLSMLKLDDETRNIPILTYTADVEGQETDEESEDALRRRDVRARPGPSHELAARRRCRPALVPARERVL